MIPGVTVGRVEHAANSSSFGYGKASTNTARYYDGIATDGAGTIAMLAHKTATITETNVNVYYSKDSGNTWTQVSGTNPTRITAIYYLTDLWIVGLGDGRLLYTSDVTSAWSSWSTSGTLISSSIFYSMLKYVGTAGHLGTTKWIYFDISGTTIRYAADLTGSWATSATTLTNLEGCATGRLGAAGNTSTVITRPGQILKFTNNTLSTSTLTEPSFTGSIRDICYHAEKNIWVSVGNAGAIATSPDSASDFTWTGRNASGELDDFVFAISIPGVGIAAGTTPNQATGSANELGRIWFSKDGTSWNVLSSADDSTRAYGYTQGGIAFSGGLFMARSENPVGSATGTTGSDTNYRLVLPADR